MIENIRLTPLPYPSRKAYKAVNHVNSMEEKQVLKLIGAKIRDEDERYIVELARALDRTKSWVVRKLLEYAVEQHKKGEFEL